MTPEEPRAGDRRVDRIRWHEDRAAELIRPDADGAPPSQGAVARARVHVALATSMRLAELTMVVDSRLRR